MRCLALAFVLAVLPLAAGQPLPYTEGAAHLNGYLARPAKTHGKVPGIVVVHQWMGLTDHERHTADALAKLGYVALAADIYGDGAAPKDQKEAMALSGRFKGDRALYLKRLQAAVETLKAQASVDPGRLAVVGFCFGGTGALEAARGGLPVLGVVSFHGGLDSPADRPVGPIAAKILVCQGADDPYAPAKDVAAFEEEMRKAKADYTFIAYGGAVHSFTQKEAGNDPSKGAAYQEAAARRSWQHMKDFFAELFKKP
jgi:dienelactone hydrolase